MCCVYPENAGGTFTQSLSRLKTPHTYHEAMKMCIPYIIEVSAESRADFSNSSKTVGDQGKESGLGAYCG